MFWRYTDVRTQLAGYCHIPFIQQRRAQEDYEVRGLEQTAVISHEFPEFDRLVIEFTKGAPNNRVILDQIAFGDSTDYVLEYGVELTKTPEGTKLPRVKELQVLRTLYSQGNGEVQELIGKLSA